MITERVVLPMKRRNRFTVSTWCVAIVLLTWGAFVTSINAGMSVPDWPSSFNSYDPFNPWPNWWTVTPVLAEHGHRLVGALVGMMTLVLAVWTWFADSRRWMKWTSLAALVLVSLQGILGGLRVVFVSLDLAIVHAGTAQLYFALLTAMIVFTSSSWFSRPVFPLTAGMEREMELRPLLLFAPAALYVQILLGALLRHPGAGINAFLVALHMAWAFFVTVLIVLLATRVRSLFKKGIAASNWAGIVLTVVTVQILLGILAYFVTLNEDGWLVPSNFQIVINTAHMVVGALLFAGVVTVCIQAARTLHTAHTTT
ncbi:MAG: cytochrome oxidase assembly protein [Bacteroidetes bacterium CG12_big_fil_rev_8_21_14_0_65_60_17]|nr:MAG: cytochrome oxidase assembly protein [Bacteroidetes bacterium CG12_big_fil_rev_8_21_14_0_65_60_17]